ncbi:MAG: hypothetical protein K5739_09655 [Lachnospiraceae bacterium]|nr:hypothetical protein [Lachnospiraceae bacterium]
MKERNRGKSPRGPIKAAGIREILVQQSGTTMVELVVSFLLLAIFLTTVTMVLSNAVLTYYNEQKLMNVYSVSDTVTKEIREDIRRMQGSGSFADGRERKGYVKLRDGAGKTVTAKTDRTMPDGSTKNVYHGESIEFLQANEKDGLLMEQMDAKGLASATWMVDTDGILKSDGDLSARITAGQLCARYYLKNGKEETDALRNLFMDRVYPASSIRDTYHGVPDGGSVLWDVEDRLPAELYQGLPITLEFDIESASEGGQEVVRGVLVTVKVYDMPESGDVADVTDPIYSRSSMIPLQNEVYYKAEDTTSFDTTY